MLYASNEEKQLYEESCQRQLKLAFSNGVVLNNDSIYTESMELEQTLCDESELIFGKCSAACFKVRIINTAESYKGLQLIPTITAGDYPRQLGVFWVDSDNLTDDKMFRDIVAYDALYTIMNTDVSEWYNSLAFPLTMKAFRDSFFAYVKVTQEETVLPNDDMLIERTIDVNKLSGADVLQSICELNACFGSMDHNGQFRYVFLKTYEDVVYPADELYPADDLYPADEFDCRFTGSGFKQGTLKYEDYRCRQITRLQIRQEENDIGVIVGEDGNSYIIEDNFLVYGKGTEELTAIALKFLVKAQYIPFSPASLECRGQPWLQVGDYIKVVGRRDTVIFPVLHRIMRGITALMDQYEAKGTECYSEKVSGITYDIRQLKGKSNVLERSIEETKSTITDLEKGVQSEIKQTADKINLSVKQKLEEYSTTTEMQSAINQTASSIQSTVKETYQTKDDMGNYSTKSETSSAIRQTADSINLEVKNKVGKNEVVSSINQSAEAVKIKAGKISLEGTVTANGNTRIDTDGTLSAVNGNFSGTITSSSATITGGTIHIETSENIGNIIELKRSGAKVQIGNDGMKATADNRMSVFQYSQIGVESGTGNGRLIAKLQDDGYGVSSYGWNTYSDRRLKNSIEELDREQTADFVYSLEPCKYKYNYDEKEIYRHGLIAQEVKEKMGDETWALFNEDVKLGDETYLGLNYLELVADLIATLQSQNKRIKKLEGIINEG